MDYTKISNVTEGVEDQTFDNTVNLAFLFYMENYINRTVDISFNKFKSHDLITILHVGIGIDAWEGKHFRTYVSFFLERPSRRLQMILDALDYVVTVRLLVSSRQSESLIQK